MNKLEYSKEDIIEMQNDIDKLQQELNQKNKIIEEIRENLYNELMMPRKFDNYNDGLYDAYLKTLSLIEKLLEKGNEDNE